MSKKNGQKTGKLMMPQPLTADYVSSGELGVEELTEVRALVAACLADVCAKARITPSLCELIAPSRAGKTAAAWAYAEATPRTRYWQVPVGRGSDKRMTASLAQALGLVGEPEMDRIAAEFAKGDLLIVDDIEGAGEAVAGFVRDLHNRRVVGLVLLATDGWLRSTDSDILADHVALTVEC